MNQEKEFRYSFTPRWKEELICVGPMGSFAIEFPMGIPTVFVPCEEEWNLHFVHYDYNQFISELTLWIESNKIIKSHGGSIYLCDEL